MAALLARLAAVPGIVTLSREVLIFSNTPAMPAMMLADRDETYPETPTGIPSVPIIDCDIVIYVNAAPLGATVNNIIDGIESAVAPAPVFNGVQTQNTQTLGGIVWDCKIVGSVEKAFSFEQVQAVAVVPVRITVV